MSPFRSQAQAKWMFSNKPAMAKEWAAKTIDMKKLPQTVGSKAKLGSGGRFKALTKKLGARKGVKNPKALAAFIGRKRYSKDRFQKLAVAGKKLRK